MIQRINATSAAADAPGWLALAAARWEDAREAFGAALREEELPEHLEGLSWAAWWLDDARTVLDARLRAYRLYRRRNDPASAARMAAWLAADHLDFHGAPAVAAGWLRRARRLLKPLPPGPDHGWVAFHSGYLAELRGDSTEAVKCARRAATLGRRYGVPDLEMLGLSLHGSVRVGRGEVDEGMALLDEAAVMALGGDAVIPISCAWTCCFLVSGCETVRDFPRAFQWCDRIAEFAARYGSCYMLGFCRAHYGAVYLWRGRWGEAETELTGAVEAYARSRPAFVASALGGLAELRRRQGRPEEAERLLDEAGAGSGLLCRAQLALDRGRPAVAAELAERRLRGIASDRRLQRAPALEVLVRACVASGESDRAAAALEELREAAGLAGTAALGAAVELAAGVLAASRGDPEAARPRLEDATDRFARCGAPFDAALARLELAATLLTLGRVAAAQEEARTALRCFIELGAEPSARRARALLHGASAVGSGAAAVLTRRECEVLRWVAEGLTNREIAGRLFISEHTVHRHMTHILRKLDLPTRTAAAAHAVRAGLLASSPAV
jgi:LuxR family transcriptional regulator, maltose regulon positive regulatory protein